MEQITVLLDKKRKYKGSLPCPQCGISLLHSCVRNAVKYVQGREGKPTKIWNADLYRCPGCKHLVLTDFGRVSEWNKENTPDLQAVINDWQGHNLKTSSAGAFILIVYSWQFRDKAAASDVFPDVLHACLELREQRIRETEHAFEIIAKTHPHPILPPEGEGVADKDKSTGRAA